MRYFLPYNLSRQGWLTDMLLAQLYDDENNDLKRMIYNSGRDDYKYAKGKLVSLNPIFKQQLEKKISKTSKFFNYVRSAVSGIVSTSIGSGKSNPDDRVLQFAAEKDSYVKFLMGMTPAQAASLQPYIRVFLKTRDAARPGVKENLNPWTTRDIVFREYTDLDFILENKFTRGSGAGIKGATITRNFPAFGLTNAYSFDIEYFFSSMAMFAKGHPEDTKYGSRIDDYLKLIQPLGKQQRCYGGKIFTGDDQRLNIEYGWRFNKNTPYDLVPRDVREVFEREERKSFQMNWVSHEFNFNENGEISLKVRYQGVPEELAYVTNLENDTLSYEKSKVINFGYDEAEKEALEDLAKNIEFSKELIRHIKICHLDDNDEQKEKKPKQLDLDYLEESIREESKKLNRLKKIMARNASKAIIQQLAAEKQLFKVSFRSGRGEGTDEQAKEHFLTFAITPGETSGERGRDTYDKVPKTNRTKLELDLPATSILRTSRMSTDVFLKSVNAKTGKSAFQELKYTGKEKDVNLDMQMTKLLTALYNSNFNIPVENGGQGHVKVAKIKDGKLTGRPDKTYGNFFFFPLRALVSWIYETASDEQKKEMPSIILGNMKTRSMGKEFWVNIGDILVELSVFREWFYETVISQGRSSWTLGDIMDSIIEDLVPAALTGNATGQHANSNFGPIERLDLNVSNSWSSGKTSQGRKLITSRIGPSAMNLGLLQDLHETELDDSLPILAKELSTVSFPFAGDSPILYYRQFSSPAVNDTEAVSPMLKEVGDRNFNKILDHQDQMYHLTIGEDRGLLKNLDFTAIKNPALQTALLFDKGQDGAQPFLKYPYEGNATMFGNNLFFQGAFFVVANNPLGVSAREDPGLRGYYRIDRVIDSISPERYETVAHGVNLYTPPPQPITSQERAARKARIAEKEKKKKMHLAYVHHDVVEYVVEDLIDFSNIKSSYKIAKATKKSELAKCIEDLRRGSASVQDVIARCRGRKK